MHWCSTASVPGGGAHIYLLSGRVCLFCGGVQVKSWFVDCWSCGLVRFVCPEREAVRLRALRSESHCNYVLLLYWLFLTTHTGLILFFCIVITHRHYHHPLTVALFCLSSIVSLQFEIWITATSFQWPSLNFHFGSWHDGQFTYIQLYILHTKAIKHRWWRWLPLNWERKSLF